MNRNEISINDKLAGLAIVVSIVIAVVLLAKWGKVDTQAASAILGALAASAGQLLRGQNNGPGAAPAAALMGGIMGGMFFG